MSNDGSTSIENGDFGSGTDDGYLPSYSLQQGWLGGVSAERLHR